MVHRNLSKNLKNLKLDRSILSPSEHQLFKKLSTPIKIQDFLDTLPQNHERNGETYRSARFALQHKTAHCLEGALIAALALWYHGHSPLLLDLKTNEGDDHVIVLYKIHGYWGAISKTNHAVLRFRDPVYKTLRELALSYFHEYTSTKTHQKILMSYSRPFDLRKLKNIDWVISDRMLDDIADAIDGSPHISIYPKQNARYMRKSDNLERKIAQIVEWK